MNLVPRIISGVSHPFIHQVYVKDVMYAFDQKPERVMVIRTHLDRETAMDHEDQILSILAELPKLKRIASRQSGSDIGEVEIRYN